MEEVIEDIPLTSIHLIENLWKSLNEMHLKDSKYFAKHYESFTFEQRIKAFDHLDEENIKISIVKNDVEILGYCISAVAGTNGEIESIYLSEKLRGKKYGKRLVEDHINWLRMKSCKKISVNVAYGHESVSGFYHSLGFFERMTRFELRDAASFQT